MAKKKVKVLPIIQLYLFAFNLISAYGWFSILYSVVDHLILTNGNYHFLYTKSFEQMLQVVQTAAVLEILHALIGIVKSNPIPTFIQVFSRLFIVYIIINGYRFVEITTSFFILTTVMAWSITEIIRYSFYALNILGQAPLLLIWMRYSFFYILYPVGAGSEWVLIRIAAGKLQGYPKYALWGMQILWLGGFYSMFTHMLRQRQHKKIE